MKPKAFIVFSSPAGTTRHVAEAIEQELKRLEVNVATLDLKNRKSWPDFQRRIALAQNNDCLFIGSPVYRGMAVPPVMAFLQELGSATGTHAVVVATWGGSSSGSALWQMGTALQQKGFTLAGALKVLGRHSIMFVDRDPLGAGRPNAEDDVIIKNMVKRLCSELGCGHNFRLALKDLDYQPEAISLKNKNNMNAPWKVTPKHVREDDCTRCGLCREECPVGVISLSPYPHFDPGCIDCLNCVRLCPEKAIDVADDLSVRAEQIKKRAQARAETPKTQAFVGRPDD